MNKLGYFYNKYKQIILYLFFGGCTTLLNIICYFVLYNLLTVTNLLSTIIAWIVSVLFAFFTNRDYVFKSATNNLNSKLYELISFFGCRIATGIMDVAIMVFAVDFMHWNGMFWKIISNGLVIIINYVASKYFIFKSKEPMK